MNVRRLSVGALASVALAAGLAAAGTLGACSTSVDPADWESANSHRIDVYSNYPGSRQQNIDSTEANDILVQNIDRARSTIDFAVMGFGDDPVVSALVRAYFRGVKLRFVGDAKYAQGGFESGYQQMDALNVPYQVGNQAHIMHNKFWVFDGRFVMTGTGNITASDFQRNDNNWVVIDSPEVAADFTAEFEQMFGGRFGFAKKRQDNGNSYQVGDTALEVYFSPKEDAAGRMTRAIELAKESIEFSIFAFTKDQFGSLFIKKHQDFQRYNDCCDPALGGKNASTATCQAIQCESPYRRKWVRGVVDQSQLHSNASYHEVYRLLAFGVPLKLDGNDDSLQPGDYQAGGGRLHSKTLLIDGQAPEPVILTGSFNWSSSATISNDETLLVLKSPRLAQQYNGFFAYLWDLGKDMGKSWVGKDVGGRTLAVGDVIFNEIHWDGYNGTVDVSDFASDLTYNDEFIELLNTTDKPLDLSLWTVATDDDFVFGFPPGTIIGPYERFLVLDHNTEPYRDLVPQELGGAFQNPSFVMNTANDARFLRLNLRNAKFKLKLVDPNGVVVDVAGNGGPPFAGGRRVDQDGSLKNYSMERVHPKADGALPASWRACQATRGGANVRDQQVTVSGALRSFKDIVIATPGEPNSSGDEPYPQFDPTFRREATP